MINNAIIISVDIQECDIANGGCAQSCENTIGSYRCDCTKPGYTLNNMDNHSCDCEYHHTFLESLIIILINSR